MNQSSQTRYGLTHAKNNKTIEKQRLYFRTQRYQINPVATVFGVLKSVNTMIFFLDKGTNSKVGSIVWLVNSFTIQSKL